VNSVLVGFGALVAVIVVGWLTGRARVLGDGAAGVLSRLSYFVATPALLLLTALPTAQNVFVYATAYDRGTSLARDVVLLSTILSVPVLTTIAIVLGTH
jgi:predicted permease